MSDSISDKQSKTGKITKLDGESNYGTWSVIFKRSLRKKKLHHLLNATWREEEGIKSNIPYSAFDESTIDKLEDVLYYMACAMKDEHHHLVNQTLIPYEAWSAIQEAFQSKGITGEYRVFSKMENLTLEDSSIDSAWDSLQTFLKERSQVYAEASGIGLNFTKLTESQLLRFEIMRLLNKLPDNLYSIFIDVTTKNLDNYTSLSQVESELRSWGETRFVIKSKTSVALSAKIKTTSRQSKKCDYCHYQGHIRSECLFDDNNSHLRPAGWTDRRRQHDRRNSYQPTANSAAVTHNIFTCMATITNAISVQSFLPLPPVKEHLEAHSFTSSQFLLDSGASNHLTCLKQNLFNAKPHKACVEFANGETRYTELIGELYVSVTYDDGNTGWLHFTEVHYAPWCKNLISVGYLVREKNMLSSISKNEHILSFNNKTVIRGLPHGGSLYFLQYNRIEKPDDFQPQKHVFVAASANIDTASNPAILAHLRLQHASFDTMLTMVKSKTIDIPVATLLDSKSTILRCPACAISKAHTQPFNSGNSTRSTRTTLRPFEMIHSDLMTTLPGEYSNVMTIIDDFSGYVWAFGLKHKSDVICTFRDWHKAMTVQYPMWLSKSIKTLRTDNGGEFVNSAFQSFCTEIGLSHQLTVPHTPQQNGVAERMNRTISNKVICALHDAKLPRSWWHYALGAAVWTINRSPNSRLLIPWECINKRKVSLLGLHPFGCHAIAKLPKSPKFADRAVDCIMLGYCADTKGYRLYDTQNKTHIVSRNVNFYDHRFPGLHLAKTTADDLFSLYDGFGSTASETSEESPHPSDSEEHTSSGRTSPEVNTPDLPNDEFFETSTTPPTSQVPDPVTFDTPKEPLNVVHTRSRGSKGLHGKISKDRGGQITEENYGFMTRLFNDNVIVAALCTIKDFHTDAEIPDELDCFIANINNEPDFPEFISDENIPKNYKQALADKLSKWWVRAMDEHIAVLNAKGTFERVPLPNGSRPINGGWVFAVKRDTQTSRVTAFKARWVLRGYKQKEGIDYSDIFSPVCKATTVRLVIAMCAQWGLTLRQGDAVAAFLTADMDQTVYAIQPTGYHIGPVGYVCLLVRALWGLKQSPLLFWKHFSTIALQCSFQQSEADKCMFTTQFEEEIVILVVYVDDFILCGSKHGVDHFFNMIASKLQIDDRGYVEEGKISNILGVSVYQNNNTLHLSQEGYILQLLTKYDADGKLAPSPTPMSGWLLDK